MEAVEIELRREVARRRLAGESPRADVASHQAGIEIVEDRADARVIGALHALWSRFGLPRRAQFDNGGPFVAPTGIGEVARVLVHQGVTPVFVPPREPWRNGTIGECRRNRVR